MALRIHQLAKELNLQSKEIIKILKDFGVQAKSHMANIDDEVADKVREFVLSKKEPPKKKEQVKKVKKEKKVLEDKLLIKEEIPKIEEVVEEKKEKILEELPVIKEVPIKEPPKEEVTIPVVEEEIKGEIEITDPISIRQLSEKMNISPGVLLRDLMKEGVIVNINQSISYELAKKVAKLHKFIAFVKEESFEDAIRTEEVDTTKLIPRPPVVTVMGHVDHGKTKLLDAIRKSNLIDQEKGGITQHIGAYQVKYNNKKIVFLDTPGHEAFTAMRARGARCTDIVVLVVAADDGVMPQTIEAINHAKAANVPLIVAINKIDKENANVERCKKQLAELGLVPEEWGGDTIFCNISAKFNRNIDELLEMILLVSEMLELKANLNSPARGTVIEAQLDKGKGPLATVLVEQGVLKVGSSVVVGKVFGKIRAMIDDGGERLKECFPVTPVEIFGLNSVPEPGDILIEVKDEKTAREISLKASERQSKKLKVGYRVTLDDLYQNIKEGKIKEINIIIKADVQGSLEAIVQSLQRLEQEQVKINIIHAQVGSITESDILLATASNAIVIGFNVRPESNAKLMAEQEGIDLRTYSVIYYLIEDVKAAMIGMLEPKYEEVILGRVEVRTPFKIPKIGIIAGCYVNEGQVVRGESLRVIRNNVIIHEGKVDSLKRFKDDVKEVQAGFECGIGVKTFDAFQEKDIIEIFTQREIKR